MGFLQRIPTMGISIVVIAVVCKPCGYNFETNFVEHQKINSSFFF